MRGGCSFLFIGFVEMNVVCEQFSGFVVNVSK